MNVNTREMNHQVELYREEGKKDTARIHAKTYLILISGLDEVAFPTVEQINENPKLNRQNIHSLKFHPYLHQVIVQEPDRM